MKVESAFDNMWQSIISVFTDGVSMSGMTVFKWVAVALLLFYLFYSFLIVRQVQLMNKFLETRLSPWTRIVALIHALYTLFLILAVLAL